MSNVNANINVNVNTSAALAELKALQRQLALFHSNINKGSAAAAAAQKNMQQNLLNTINSTGKFTATMGTVRTSTESFTHALEKNKMSMGQYFKYAGASTKTFGRMFKSEMDTINKVAEDRVRRMQTQYIKMGRDATGAMKAMAITPTTLNMQSYQNQLAVAAQKQALFNQLMKQGSANLLNFGKNTQWAGRQLMVGFSVPLMYLGTAAAKVFMDLEKQTVRFKRVYGDMFTTSGQTDKALQDIRNIADEYVKYGVKVADTIGMAADAAAAGFQGKALESQVKQANKLAVLGQIEQQQALETTISLQNAFGISSDELGKKIDFLNAVENQTVVSLNDITTAIPKVAPVIKQLGGSVEDLAFFMTAMEEGGISAAQGANALKSGLASLINPTKQAREMLAGMGIDINAIVEGNAGNLSETVKDFAQALDGLAPLQRARAIEQLFGKFQFARMSTLFQNVSKDGNQASRVLDLAGKSVEELAILSERELKTVEDAVGTNFKKSVEELKMTLAPVGKEFLKAVTPIVGFLSKLFDKFNNLSDGSKKFIVVMTTLVGIVGPALLMTFGLVANGAANIIKLFLALRMGFQKLTGNSKVLAEQTQYMNSEQLEAATVAASLNQAHSRLIQTFALEKSEIEMLRKAYVDATLAAERFALANPGAMLPGRGQVPKKFADGTTNVPGPRGAGDVVPSMLSPGEAVIPAGTAQDNQFKPLVNALVTGDIKKYELGTNNAGSNVGGDTVFAHASDARVLRGSNVPSDLASKGFSSARGFTSIGFDIPKSMNAGLINGNVLASDYIKAISEPLAVKTMTAKLIKEGFSKTEAAQLTKQIRSNLVRSLSGLPSGALVSDAMVYSRMGNLKTGILGKLATKGGAFEKAAIESLWGVSTYSPLGKSSANFNATRPISEVLATVSAKAKSQSMVAPLRNLQKLHPTMELPVVVDNKGNIVGYVRPEISSKTGKITGTQNMGLLGADGKFSAARLGRGGGRKLTLPKSVLKAAEDTLLGTNVVAVSTKEGVAKKGGKFQPNTGQNTRPLPTGAKTTSGVASDNRLRVLKPGESVYKAPARRFIGKADAPMYGPKMEDGSFTTSQSAELRAQKKLQAEKVNRAMGAVTALTFAASFAGGNLGKLAQTIMPLVFTMQALTTIMQMEMATRTKMMLGYGAVIVGAIVAWKMIDAKLREAAIKTSKYIDSTSATTEKMKLIGEVTKKVGASELAAKRREGGSFNEFTTGYDRAGQQFGTNFLDSEVGKDILKGFKEDLAKDISDGVSDGGSKAVKNIGYQLSAYVADGLMTAEDANSVARSIGVNMQDMSIAANIRGQITEILGPDGQDLEKSPLVVRLKIAENAAGDVQSYYDQFMSSTDSFGEFLFSTEDQRNTIAALAAAGAQSLETIQAQRDGQNELYNKQIAALQAQLLATKDKDEQLRIESQITDLKSKQASDDAKLGAKRLETLEVLQMGFERAQKVDALSIDKPEVKAFWESLNSQITTKFGEDDPLVKTFLDAAAGTESQTLELKIKALVASGGLPLGTATKLITMFGEDKEPELESLLTTTFSVQDPGKVTDLINLAGGLKGDEDNAVGLKLITDITAAGDEDLFNGRMQALMLLQEMDGKEFSLTAFLKGDGLAKIDKLVPQLTAIENIKGNLTKDLLINIQEEGNIPGIDKNNSKLQGLINDWEYYDNLPNDIKKTVVQTYLSVYETIDQENAASLAKEEARRRGLKGRSAGAFMTSVMQKGADGKVLYDAKGNPLYDVGSLAAELTQEQFAPGKVPNVIPKGNGITDGDKSKRDTTLDDLLTRLKRTRDLTIDAQGGIKELMRVLGGKADIKVFRGLDEQLAQIKNSPEDFIDFIGGMDKAIQKGYLKVDKKNKPILDKNGNLQLTPEGVAAQKGYQEASMGDYVANAAKAIVASQNQRTAMLKLTAAGMDSKEALDALSDSNFANAVAAATDKNEIKELAKAQKEQAAEADRTLKANDPVGYFQKYKDLAMERLNAEADFIRLSYEPKIKEQQLLVDAVNDEIRTKQRLLEVDGVLGQRRIDSINKEIDAMQHALQMGVEKQLSALSNQSSAYSEDLAIINHTVDGINKKYDKQEEALSKINDINKEIAQQQRQQLDLADALSQGDIAAAAKAAQAMRQSAADAAAQSASDMLKAAREAEIASVKSAGGLTADQIAERQYQIDRQSYQLNLQRQKTEETIAGLQEQIYQINLQRETTLKSIQDLEDKVYNLTYNQVDGIDTLQKKMAALLKPIDDQKLGWEKAQNAIDLAQTSTDAFKDSLNIANGLLTTIAGLWKTLDKKTLEISLKLIEGAIQGATPTTTKYSDTTSLIDTKPLETVLTDATKSVTTAQTNLTEAQRKYDSYLNLRSALGTRIADSTYPNVKANLDAAKTALESAKTAESAAQTALDAAKQSNKTFLAAQEADAKAGGTAGTGTAGTGTAGSPAAVVTPTYGVWDATIGGVLGDPNKSHGSLAGIVTGKDGKMYNSWTDGTWTPYVATTTSSSSGSVSTTTPTSTTNTTSSPAVGAIDVNSNGFFDGLNSLGDLGGLNLNIDYDMLSAIDWSAFAKEMEAFAMLSTGGLVPKYFASGGYSRGTDTIPAMLTPGEFVIRRKAVDKFGINNLNRINSGDMSGAPVYNYKVDVTLNGSNMDPNDVANAVMTKIKQVESKNIRRNTI